MLPIPGLTDEQNSRFAYPFKDTGEYDEVITINGATVFITKIPVTPNERNKIHMEIIKINESIYINHFLLES